MVLKPNNSADRSTSVCSGVRGAQCARMFICMCVWMGVRQCVRVWAGVCGFSQMSDVSGFASVCGGAGVRGCAQMCEDVHRYVWVCTGVRWCAL